MSHVLNMVENPFLWGHLTLTYLPIFWLVYVSLYVLLLFQSIIMLDVLADVLQPYKELVGSIAAIVTVGQMFSGSFICWDIYKQGNTRGIGIMPFLGGVVM